MLKRLWNSFIPDCRLDCTRIVVVGVSGGPDSLCLMDLLWRAEFPILVAHLNHGLRPEAREEESQLQRLVEGRDIPFVAKRADATTFSREHSLSIEEAARVLRYRFLFDEAVRVGAQAVAVAHTANDQVETVLMHLLRGAGLSGLKGMEKVLLPNPWSREIPLVRPFLDVWREEVLDYCREHDLHPFWDRTNQDPVYLRNRLRLELIPHLETYNPRLRSILLQMARSLQLDYTVVDQVVQAAWRDCLIQEGEGWLGFSRAAINRQLPGVQCGLVRQAFLRLSLNVAELGFEEVERVLAFVRVPPATCRSDLAAGLSLAIEGDVLWLKRVDAALPVDDWPQIEGEMQLSLPGSLELPGSWRLIAELVEATPELRARTIENRDFNCAWIDADRVGPMVLRPRRPGDRFQPFGLEGHSLKISDYMVNVKLPGRLRRNWPLLFTAEQVVWVPGYALAYPFRLTDTTRMAVRLLLSKNKL